METKLSYKAIRSFTNFVVAREALRIRKENGMQPWTGDEILREYRFCNIRREHDAVTRWIEANWRTPDAFHDNLWFAMVVARLLNLPESLAAVGFPIPWRPRKFIERLNARKKTGQNVFNAAYIVSTNGLAVDKVEYITLYILEPLWEQRGEYQPRGNDTLESFYKRLRKANGLGNFMAAQVVADMKYAPCLRNARDWYTFAASGPGSRRGMNRLLGLPLRAHLAESVWHTHLLELMRETNMVLGNTFPAECEQFGLLHAQDIQNCLCEYDKYERTRLGEGRPKSKYRPS